MIHRTTRGLSSAERRKISALLRAVMSVGESDERPVEDNPPRESRTMRCSAGRGLLVAESESVKLASRSDEPTDTGRPLTDPGDSEGPDEERT